MVEALYIVDTWLLNHQEAHPLLLLPVIYAHLHHLQAFTHLNERLLAIYLNTYLIKVTELTPSYRFIMCYMKRNKPFKTSSMKSIQRIQLG
jgi:hypothetical protein